ncbi:hypothetical protein D1610_07710 [Sphingomonas gilva]|uniref:Uncharacterized protein n=1 Tax=Sphingomonas gilva TaxID=2305907 RepID=A0A396RP98_9SPHN|nr:circularly permuted type 2 ATP-grasp protein [Sphingomonas gilva]RHW18340.1 hypothetical protein D1610_07710 [Sphingomonas gilva]
MADAPEPSLFDAGTHARRWIDGYVGRAPGSDVLSEAMRRDLAPWVAMFEELAGLVGDDLSAARERVLRQTEDIGTGYRILGEEEERPWPLSPVPLLIERDEWNGIAQGIAQRAGLMETLLRDIYGEAKLVSAGVIPAALIAGSPHFLRQLVGIAPPGGHHLHVFAADLGRGPTGEWRVLADHLRAPIGAGYALENRLAVSRVLGGLQGRLNLRRHAPFFEALRAGIGAACRRSDPRIALLTPGRFNQSYAEQAHLARYLGLLLVEGADLAVHDEQLYVRTIAGLKRIDAVWRQIDPRWLDPLAFDSHSQIGVAGLFDAYAAGNTVIANAPGAGALESPAIAAFLPKLARRLTGADLAIPNIATWWCGQPREAAQVIENFDSMLIGPAFAASPLGLPEGRARLGAEITGGPREALLTDMSRRPQDYVGQEVVRLSTMPVVIDGALAPRPFSLRVFAARDAHGEWTVLPGGFARIGDTADPRAAVMGDGAWSADVGVHGPDRVPAISLLPDSDTVRIRRNPGTLPSRVADNLYWLGRYLERAEALLAAIRVVVGASVDADASAALGPQTLARLAGLLTPPGELLPKAPLRRGELTSLARAAFEGGEHGGGLKALMASARAIGGGSRERLSADTIRLLDAPFPMRGTLADRSGTLQRRLMALAGIFAAHMGRTDAWRFHDLGRHIERPLAAARHLQIFGRVDASADDLTVLLDLADAQITYRQRYPMGLARLPVVDLVALDPNNPRAIASCVERVERHLCDLPVLGDDGMAEPQQAAAVALAGQVRAMEAGGVESRQLRDIERRLMAISDLVAGRYFLQGAEPLRAAGLTLA